MATCSKHKSRLSCHRSYPSGSTAENGAEKLFGATMINIIEGK